LIAEERARKRAELLDASFRSLLGHLATVTHNTMAMADQPDATFTL
jgi:hypothetical protein